MVGGVALSKFSGILFRNPLCRWGSLASIFLTLWTIASVNMRVVSSSTRMLNGRET